MTVKDNGFEDRPVLLVVDNSATNLRLLSDIFSKQGYEVRCVTSGKLALDSIETDEPDLILLDINMPEMDGFEVASRIKAVHSASIPIIFLSAYRDTDSKVKAFENGGVDYVTKPFEYQELTSRVKMHLQFKKITERAGI